MARRADPRPVDVELLRAVSSRAQLSDIATLELRCSAARPPRSQLVDGLHQVLEYRASRVDLPAPTVMCRLDFDYQARVGREPLVQIGGALAVVYQLDPLGGHFSDEALDQFAEFNGVYNAWSYLRETVGSLAARLGLSGVLLPVWMPPATLPPRGESLRLDLPPRR